MTKKETRKGKVPAYFNILIAFHLLCDILYVCMYLYVCILYVCWYHAHQRKQKNA